MACKTYGFKIIYNPSSRYVIEDLLLIWHAQWLPLRWPFSLNGRFGCGIPELLANAWRVLIAVPFSRKLAVDLLAREIDFVFPRDMSAVRRNLVIQPNSPVRQDVAFCVCSTPIAIDLNLLPLVLRHIGNTRKAHVQKQEQFSWRGRAFNFRQEQSDTVAIYFETACSTFRGLAVRGSEKQQNA